MLIGDALASAHFSIGSGTGIAMGGAKGLARALLSAHGDARAGQEAYEREHAPRKHKLIEASERSFMWYERTGESMERYTPEEFAYQFMTRTGRVDDDRLRQKFPALTTRLDAGRQPAGAGA